MVSLLIVALLLAVLQVAVYVHVRNVVTASAQAGARYAANADVDARRRADRRGGGAGGDGADGRGLSLQLRRGGRCDRADARGGELHRLGAVAAGRAREPAASGGHRPGSEGSGMTWLRRRLGMLAEETGSALVEFVFIALV